MSSSPKVYKRPRVAGKAIYLAPEADGSDHISSLLCVNEEAPVQTAPPSTKCAQGAESPDLPDLVQLKEQCIQDGYKQGIEQAEAECRRLTQEAQDKLKEAEMCLRAARQRSREMIDSSEGKVVELAVAAAEQLIKTQLELAPEKIVYVVRETLRLLNGGGQLRIYVSPVDLPACLEMRESLNTEFQEVNRLEILPDGALGRGSCRIESENGSAEHLLYDESRRLREMLLDIARQAERKKAVEGAAVYDRR